MGGNQAVQVIQGHTSQGGMDFIRHSIYPTRTVLSIICFFVIVNYALDGIGRAFNVEFHFAPPNYFT